MVGIDHVQLAMPVGEEHAARAFYGAVLGLHEVAKPAALAGRGGCWFTTDPTGARGTRVDVHLGVEADFRPARKAHPAFVVRDLDEAATRLAAFNAMVEDSVQLDGQRRLHIGDPWGNRIELIEYPLDSVSP